MKYFLALFVFGILCQKILARGLDNPVLNDFERRLVRLETRQFSESENLEHRMLQLETKLGTHQGEEKLETNPNEISNVEKEAEGMTFLQRLEKVERSWVEKLEVLLRELSSKHENLSERFSAIESQVRKAQEKASLSEKAEKKSVELEENEFIFVKPKTKPETGSGYGESELEFGSGYGESEVKIGHTVSNKFRKIGENYFYVEENALDKKTWESAVVYCKQLNAHLVSLQDEGEWLDLASTLPWSRNYWIDINDRSTEGKFVSESTGKTDPFLKWGYNEPSSSPGDGHCVELRADMIFRMHKANCLAENFYVCKLN